MKNSTHYFNNDSTGFGFNVTKSDKGDQVLLLVNEDSVEDKDLIIYNSSTLNEFSLYLESNYPIGDFDFQEMLRSDYEEIKNTVEDNEVILLMLDRVVKINVDDLDIYDKYNWFMIIDPEGNAKGKTHKYTHSKFQERGYFQGEYENRIYKKLIKEALGMPENSNFDYAKLEGNGVRIEDREVVLVDIKDLAETDRIISKFDTSSIIARDLKYSKRFGKLGLRQDMKERIDELPKLKQGECQIIFEGDPMIAKVSQLPELDERYAIFLIDSPSVKNIKFWNKIPEDLKSRHRGEPLYYQLQRFDSYMSLNYITDQYAKIIKERFGETQRHYLHRFVL